MAEKRFPDIESMIAALQPSEPVYCLRPTVLRERAEWFVTNFPGKVLYAVKCNPNPSVLRHLYAGGIRHFDTASLTEIAEVSHLFGDAISYFMHPIKGRQVIGTAHTTYGVRHYVADHPAELEKLLEVTGGGPDVAIFVRLATPGLGAAYDLSDKFGARGDDAVDLLRRVQSSDCQVGVCFHVGSQCSLPEAYRYALDLSADVLKRAAVDLRYLDVGGGFPATYVGMAPIDMAEFFESIDAGLAQLDLPEDCELLCEPGRALVADGCTLVTQVQLRKDDRLYINDGVYGSLNETLFNRIKHPCRLIRNDGEPSARTADFMVNGPTCDSADVVPYAMPLPDDAREGDWIEFGIMGAYSNATATQFNGFYPDTYVEIEREFAT